MPDTVAALPVLVYVIEVDIPDKGWTRMQARYKTRDSAKGWLSFVRKYWHGLPVRVVPHTDVKQ